ncbi:TonB-dependent receptor [Cytophagaceae bacterium DM2B3-1]|uniref:TonB-dependent receptor n=1 Tax=Xanthocytophaga flava TaxID=3048013 RepID=A0ABT7CHR9_9BACT|nr:TonB-dependent receptor [Xanthocytophaga flavus]MDJ1493289.1 TonB-dependent receptor [Xanthocytophaga flavus]
MNQLYRCMCLFVSYLLCTQLALAQEKFTISGYVKDSKNGENLIGVAVFVKGTSNGTVTNEYGFYSLTLPSGTYSIGISYVGYQSFYKDITLNANVKQDVELTEEGVQLNEIVVTADRPDANVRDVSMSVNKLDIKTIQKIPAFLGEVDVIRSIQLLPGVSTIGEGATGFNVRGGSIDQNLVLIDEAPVYNSAHLFGFFSVFNPDIVKDVKLIKGGIPAQYGGRLSSILDVRTKEGNNKKFSGQGGIGVIFSRLSLEAPLIKDKASFVIGARRSYIDVLAKPFLNEDLKGSKFYFYDLTSKVNYIINPKNTVYLSGYFGRDVFGSPDFRFAWGSTTASARWNHLYNDKLFMNLTAFYSNYDYELGFQDNIEKSEFNWNAKIINLSIKPDFTYYINTKNTLRFGAQGLFYNFHPGNTVVTSEGIPRENSLPNKYALESGIYIDNEQKISSKLTIQYGLRYSLFQYLGSGDAYYYNTPANGERRQPSNIKHFNSWKTIASYNNLEPRFSANYTLNDRSSVKASYNRTAQYIHLVSNTAASTPLDVWTPSTNNVKPQLADQIALGYFRNFQENTYEASVEVYYKELKNQLDYVNSANLLLNYNLEGDLLQGIGRAYGMEFSVRKATGRLTGFISYTLAKTERRLANTIINHGKWFPNRFDRLHNLSVTADYMLTPLWSIAANFVYQSGTPITFYTNRAEFGQLPSVPLLPNEDRNNSRNPDYHRLDISATKKNKKKEGRKWESYWVFSVYNAYNRRNPFSIYFQNNPDYKYAETNNGVPKTQAIRYSIIGSFVPAVSYNFKF